jgi:hypothetical protein
MTRRARTLGPWVLAVGGALYLSWQTKVGPAVAVSPRHGVHVGDVASFAVLLTWAFLATVVERRRR